MKILKNYKNLVSELFEVDDTKIIKYKDKDGENKEMLAKSAKTMPDEHPAKQAWDKEKEKEDGGEEEKPSGQKLGGSDFDRIQISDPDDEDSEVGKYLKSKGMTGYDDSDDEGDIDRSKRYDGRISGDDSQSKDEVPSTYSSDELESISFKAGDEEADDIADEISDEVIGHFSEYGENEENADIARDAAEEIYNRYQNPQGVAPSQRNMKAYRDSLIRDIEYKIKIAKVKKNPKSSLKKSKGTMGSVGVREPGQAGSGMYDSVQPKKKPFLKEQLERIGGGKY